jgi:hypothetical protein
MTVAKGLESGLLKPTHGILERVRKLQICWQVSSVSWGVVFSNTIFQCQLLQRVRLSGWNQGRSPRHTCWHQLHNGCPIQSKISGSLSQHPQCQHWTQPKLPIAYKVLEQEMLRSQMSMDFSVLHVSKKKNVYVLLRPKTHTSQSQGRGGGWVLITWSLLLLIPNYNCIYYKCHNFRLWFFSLSRK